MTLKNPVRKFLVKYQIELNDTLSADEKQQYLLVLLLVVTQRVNLLAPVILIPARVPPSSLIITHLLARSTWLELHYCLLPRS